MLRFSSKKFTCDISLIPNKDSCKMGITVITFIFEETEKERLVNGPISTTTKDRGRI